MSRREIHIICLIFSCLYQLQKASSQSASFGNTFIHNMGESVIFGVHDFDMGSNGILPGIIGTERTNDLAQYGVLGFSDVSGGWTGIGDDSYVDGYVKIYGDDPFVFPVGDNGKFRPVAISGADGTTVAYYKVDPELATTSDLFGGRYGALPFGGPFPRSSKSNLVVHVSDLEYWDIDGSEPTKITLTWDIFSEIDRISDNNLDKLSIIAWDGTEWVVIPSDIDFLHLNNTRSSPIFNAGLSNFVKGSITTLSEIVPDDYLAFTFGAVASGTIGDFVWEDMNRDGIQDLGEPGLEGIKVELYVHLTDSLYMTTFTAANGRYILSGLPADTYYLQFYPPDGYAPTLPFQGASSKNSDLTFQSTVAPFILAENEKKFDIDGGYYRTGLIGDLVWLDENRDGIQDPDEMGMDGVRVELYRAGESELLASTITNSDGIYNFTNVPPDEYYVKIIPPLYLGIGPLNATLNDSIDSDINPFTGNSEVISLVSGEIHTMTDAALSEPCLYVSSLDVEPPTCGGIDGSIHVIVDGVGQSFRYEWSTGDTTSFVENIDSGFYSVLVKDETSCSQALEVYVDYDEPCALVCADINARVFLEGPFNYDELKMESHLNRLGYLPGQRPTTFLGKYSPAGHPYNDEPWFMGTSEGQTFESGSVLENNNYYDEDVVDWVLVSLREREDVEYEVCSRAGLLHEDGTISFVDDNCCLINPDKDYYIVIEHRNHLVVMTPTPQPVMDHMISFDFTSNDSYKRLIGYTQKEITRGVFAMFAANGDQYLSGESAVDINVNDHSEWLKQNGEHSSYYRHDFDMNGDANVVDKGLYLKNIGIFSDVPKGD